MVMYLLRFGGRSAAAKIQQHRGSGISAPVPLAFSILAYSPRTQMKIIPKYEVERAWFSPPHKNSLRMGSIRRDFGIYSV